MASFMNCCCFCFTKNGFLQLIGVTWTKVEQLGLKANTQSFTFHITLFFAHHGHLQPCSRLIITGDYRPMWAGQMSRPFEALGLYNDGIYA